MKIEFTRAWCERMAKREISAGLSDIEAGGMSVANPSEAFLADSTRPDAAASSPSSLPCQGCRKPRQARA